MSLILTNDERWKVNYSDITNASTHEILRWFKRDGEQWWGMFRRVFF